ncbi:hypothetical protein IID24_04975 [Patescibacteria group bacterium]|nr:hypothetical protein [Patescibacteria group bacterium]
MVSYDSGPEISVGIGNESLTGIHKIVVDQDEQQIELHAERQITMVDSTGKILTPTT